MTKIRHKQLKKLVREHPCLIDRTFLMSSSHAHALWKEAGGYPSMDAIVTQAKLSYDFPASFWEPVDHALDKRKGGGAILLHTRGMLRTHKKLAIALGIILSLSLFFGCVPVGRAMVKEAIQYVIQVFDDGYRIRQSRTDGAANQVTRYVEPREFNFSSFEEFENAFDKEALQVVCSDLHLNKLYVKIDSLGTYLFAEYSSTNGGIVETRQEWDISSEYFGDTSNMKAWEEAFWDGTKAYCYYYNDESVFHCIALWNNSHYSLYAYDGMDYSDLISYIVN